jgi:hypothetical protein
MSPFYNRALVISMIAFALTACGAQSNMPSQAQPAGGGATASLAAVTSPADTTSILKLLKKDVVIGSTVDPTNGDQGPRAISMVTRSSGKLKKGQLLVCNFTDSSGKVGNGTTIEQLDDAPNSSPATFIENSEIEGCDGDAISTVDGYVYATGLTSKLMAGIDTDGQIKKTYGSPIMEPIGDGYLPPIQLYASNYIFTGDAKTGAIVSLDLGIVSARGYPPLSVVTGFAVNKGTGWGALGPSGLAYNKAKKVNTLYVADGACNAIVAIYGASNLLVSNEITVGKGCKTFKCKYPSSTCGKVVLAGKPLDTPVAEVILPNGNLIVANTGGGNTLVETTPTGQVLDTKVIDKSKTAGIFGLLAIGKTDSDTALFYTDTNDNSLHELSQ